MFLFVFVAFVVISGDSHKSTRSLAIAKAETKTQWVTVKKVNGYDSLLHRSGSSNKLKV